MVVSGLVLLLLAGCDDSGATQGSIANQAFKQGSEKSDSTAIYIRSGCVLILVVSQ